MVARLTKANKETENRERAYPEKKIAFIIKI